MSKHRKKRGPSRGVVRPATPPGSAMIPHLHVDAGTGDVTEGDISVMDAAAIMAGFPGGVPGRNDLAVGYCEDGCHVQLGEHEGSASGVGQLAYDIVKDLDGILPLVCSHCDQVHGVAIPRGGSGVGPAALQRLSEAGVTYELPAG